MTVQRRSVSSSGNTDGVSATLITVTKPQGVTDGELMLAVTNGPVGTVTAPAGWTLLHSAVDGSLTQSNAYKRIADSEGASYDFTFPSSSACRVVIISFVGGRDVLLYDANATGTDSTPTARATDAARDAVGYGVICWRDSATNTVTADQGNEDFDFASSNTGSTIYRGYAGYTYGPGSSGIADIVNVGDSLPGTTFTISGAPGAAIVWQFLIDNKAPDTENWSSTDGDFGVDLKLDLVALDELGGIDTPLRGDITTQVSAVSALGEAVGEEADNLTDGLLSTKWHHAADASWVQYDFGTSKTVRRYRLVSGDDNAVEDPMDWTLQGSANGSDFTVIDTRENESFSERGQVAEFRVADPGDYRYYRLDVSSNRFPSGAAGTSLAEWRVSDIDIWENVTSYVQEESKIRITRGLQGASGRSDFSRAYVTLNNTDGRFSLHNLNGTYSGALQRNTEMRIHKAYGTKTLQLQGAVELAGTDMCGDGCRTALTTALQITGDIDIRIDLEPESWRDEQMLAGVAHAEDADEAWSLFMSDDGVLHLTWHDGTDFFDVSSEFAVPQAARQAIRVTLDVDNGASGHDLSFYTSDTIDGEWTQLGSTITGSGTTAIAYTGGALCVGHVGSRSQRGIHGSVYGFELRTGIGGTKVSEIDFTALDNGAHAWTENSNVWVTVNNAVVSNRHYRFHGEVPEWPLYWDTTGNWVEVSATGAGVQKRLERGSSELSAMRRHHTKGVIENPSAFEHRAEPAAYWPMEDGEGAFQVSSGLPGKPAMQVSGGTPVFATFSDFHESAALPKIGNAKFGGRVAGNSSGYADIRWIMHAPSEITATANILTLYGSGTVARWELDYFASGFWRVRGIDENDAGTYAWDTGSVAVTTVGEYLHCQLILDQNGTGVDVSLRVYNRFGELVGTVDDTFIVATVGRIYRANVNDDDTVKMDEVYMGHLAVYGADSPALTSPLDAHRYEAAGERVKRLCEEEGIQFRHVGALADSGFMGYQEVTTPFPLMSSAAVTDDGFLVDPLDAFGVEYRTLRSMFNRVAHLTLSYTGFELSGELQPVADDSYLVNDFTASRGEAGSARYRLDTGPLSVNAPPNGVGEYSDSQSYSFAHEGQCVDTASWNVHKGTLDEARYPRVEVALENLRIAADSALTERILRLDVGKRIDITDTPDFLAHEDIRQIVVGYEEWFDNFQHNFKLNTVPERWFEVAEYDADYRFDPEDAVLYQDITSAATSMIVSSPTGPVLSYEAKATPYEIDLGGEVVRVDQVSTMAVVSNAFFDSDVTGWTSESSTLAHSTAIVHPNPVAAASMLITPAGGVATVGAVSTHTPVGSVTAQNEYTVSFWAYSPDGWADVQTGVSWYTSADALISTSSGTTTAVPAGQWTFLEQTFTAPATSSRAGVRARLGSTPTSGDTLYVWAVRCQPAPSFEGSDKGDSFNRADSTTTPGSTDRGVVTAWTEDLGAWGINGNAAYISAAANSYMTTTGTADFEELSVTMSTWASGEGWLNFRYTDGSNRLRFGGTVATAAVLTVISGGVSTRTVTADDTYFTLAAGDRLTVRCTGSVIECFVNGALAICVTETTQQSATRIGLQTATTAPRFDDFYFNSTTSTQTVQITRGRNGVSVPHEGDTSIALYRAPYRGV